jgi:hypothetical protein
MSADILRFGTPLRLCLRSGGFRLPSVTATAHTLNRQPVQKLE